MMTHTVTCPACGAQSSWDKMGPIRTENHRPDCDLTGPV